MKLTNLVIPPWVRPTAYALAFAGAFYAGWTVRGWYEAKSDLTELKGALKAGQKQQDKIHTEGTKYEQGKEAARVANGARQQTIRTIYTDRVVPGDCSAPDAVRSVLQDGVRSANSQARGEPVAALPATTGPAGRPD